MDRSNVITLIGRSRQQDEYGVWRDNVDTRRDVFCQVNSVSRAEFFSAGQSGLKPEFMFTVFSGDYEGEQLAEFNGVIYSIYRTYHARNDTTELYVQRREGVANG